MSFNPRELHTHLRYLDIDHQSNSRTTSKGYENLNVGYCWRYMRSPSLWISNLCLTKFLDWLSLFLQSRSLQCCYTISNMYIWVCICVCIAQSMNRYVKLFFVLTITIVSTLTIGFVNSICIGCVNYLFSLSTMFSLLRIFHRTPFNGIVV